MTAIGSSKIWGKLRSFFAKIKQKHRSFAEKTDKHPIAHTIIVALILNFVIESMTLRSFDGAFIQLFTDFPVFLYNYTLILATISFSTLFTRRKYLLGLLSSAWFLLALTNFILLFFRTTPLTAIDFVLIFSVFPIITKYLEIWQIILIAIALILLIILAVYFGIKSHKTPVKYRVNIIFTACSVVAVSLLSVAFINIGVLSTSFSNLADAFKEYGFAYCFGISIVDSGIDKPEEYSDDLVIEIEDDLESDFYNSAIMADEDAPNIVMVQLESFFDVTYLNGIEYSEDPLPNFRYLKENFASGSLSVPSIGAGTANTEFEVLTGMSLDYFGTGEYPYKTILQKTTCESICYNLKEYDYVCHALHNNSATFYDRNHVFANLGFDTFTSIEYMEDIEYTALEWATDDVLTNEISKILDSTKERDFVFGISVQAHGKYPSGLVADGQHITVSGLEDAAEQSSFEYYIGQLHETDRFIGKLVNELAKRNERVILVLYGDHLPSFDFTNEDLSTGDILATDYVIWSNFGLVKNSRDLETYQLSSFVLAQLGITTGHLTKFHQQYYNHDEYQQYLELLEYDMLYGEQTVFDGVNPYERTDLQMGTAEISIDDVQYKNGQYYIYGQNFTTFSTVFFDDTEMDTIFVDKTMLIVREEMIDSISVSVSQIGDDSIILSTTNIYKYK